MAAFSQNDVTIAITIKIEFRMRKSSLSVDGVGGSVSLQYFLAVHNHRFLSVDETTGVPAFEGRTVIDEPLAEVERTWSTAIERYFEPARAIA